MAHIKQPEMFDYEPEIGDTKTQPSLRDILFQYYQPRFGTEASSIVVNHYITELMAMVEDAKAKEKAKPVYRGGAHLPAGGKLDNY